MIIQSYIDISGPIYHSFFIIINFVVHIFQNADFLNNNVSIKIGDENSDDKLKDLSVLTTGYSLGDVKGKIGVIGPKRMNYAKMITLLEYTSKLITETVM